MLLHAVVEYKDLVVLTQRVLQPVMVAQQVEELVTTQMEVSTD